MNLIHATKLSVAGTLPPSNWEDMLLAAGVAALALGFVLAKRGYVMAHKRSYTGQNGQRLLHAGAGFFGVGIVLSVSAVIIWLAF